MNKEILRLAIPNIISNISVPLLSTVDTALMGRLSALHIGAVGIGSMIFNFIYWNFGFLRMGTTGLTAQAYGKEDQSEIINLLGRANITVLVIAGLVLIFQIPIAEASFYFMGINAEQESLISEYFYIRIWAAPATLASYAFLGWFFGMQNAIIPLILVVSVNIVNILLSFYFVHYQGMDIAGVAYGTLIAQYFGLLLGLILFFVKYNYLLAHWQNQVILQWQKFTAFLKLNADIFLRTLLLTGAFGFFYSQSAKEGELILAVNAIFLQFLNWMSHGIDGFAFASESLVGKYRGAKDLNKTKQAIRLSFIWGMTLALLFSVTYGLFGTKLVAVFTNQEEVIQAAIPFLIWIVLFPVLSTPCYIWDGIFIGLTASKTMRNSMVIAFAIYLLTYWLFGNRYGNHGLLLAFLIFMAARGLVQWGYFRWNGLELK